MKHLFSSLLLLSISTASYGQTQNGIDITVWGKSEVTKANWQDASNYCKNYSEKGKKWRLPKQIEILSFLQNKSENKNMYWVDARKEGKYTVMSAVGTNGDGSSRNNILTKCIQYSADLNLQKPNVELGKVNLPKGNLKLGKLDLPKGDLKLGKLDVPKADLKLGKLDMPKGDLKMG
ncbi:MAG: hypothetical protein AAF518_26815, partial [Spirochaetota bacterium]